ncbi:MAG: phosphoglycerate dehydrogenase [Dissulfuribacterales bacterium]
MKIAITTTSFGKFDNQPLQCLNDEGYEVVLNPYGRKLSGHEAVELAKNAAGIIAGTESLDRSVLKNLPCLKIISRCGAGVDNIDLETASELNIKVLNTPFGPTLAVAELTVGLILDLLRKSTWMDREMRAGVWKKRMGNLLFGKKVGIIGLGRIGKMTAQLLMPFGCELGYYDSADDIQGLDNLTMKRLTLNDLLHSSDIISVHVSGKYEKPLLGDQEFKTMKEGSWIVNVSRGGAIDEDLLYNAIKDGRLAGAAMDVFEKEPYNGPLKNLENIILTPHIGSYAKEARTEMERQAAINLIEGLK